MQDKTYEIKQKTEGKIVIYKAVKQVKRIGSTGRLLVPGELIGRYMRVELLDEEELK